MVCTVERKAWNVTSAPQGSSVSLGSSRSLQELIYLFVAQPSTHISAHSSVPYYVMTVTHKPASSFSSLVPRLFAESPALSIISINGGGFDHKVTE